MSGPPYKVCPYSIDDLKKILAEKSKNSIDEVGKKIQVIYLEDYFAKLAAKSIIIENFYVDRDFIEDYAGYYVRCHKSYDRLCTRLHFFDILITPKNFDSILQGRAGKALFEEFINSYLGFVVVKPLPETIIGRTCLKTYGGENGRRDYPIIQWYDANLFGLALKVESLAFQEQDNVVAACATSALWSAFHRTGRIFQHPILSPVEITRTACDHMPLDTRAFPNTGLSAEQIAQAIRRVNLEPYTEKNFDQEFLKANVYGYLKMGIPLLLCVFLVDVSRDEPILGNHAVAVTGYNQGLPEPVPSERSGFLTMSSQIDEIYAHDDQVGPFSRMVLNQGPIVYQNDIISSNSISTFWRDEHGTIGGIKAVPFMIFIPLYHKIRIPLKIVRRALVAFDELAEALRDLGVISLPKRLVWDVYLTTINRFKENIFRSDWTGKRTKRDLLLERMPRFLWRATAFCEEEPVLDLLFDATDIERGSFLAKAIPYYPELLDVFKEVRSDPELVTLIKAEFPLSWKIIGDLR